MALPSNYFADFNLYLRDVNPIVNLFMDSLFIAKGSVFSGKMKFGQEESLFFKTRADSISWKNHGFGKNDFVIFTDKKGSEDSVFYSLESIFSSSFQNINGFPTKNLSVNATRIENRIVFESSVDHANSNDNASVSGNIGFFADRSEISLGNTTFKVLNNIWVNNGINKLTWQNDELLFTDMSFAAGNKQIRADGFISPDSVKHWIFCCKISTSIPSALTWAMRLPERSMCALLCPMRCANHIFPAK